MLQKKAKQRAFAGKVVLITGAARGIGHALALGLVDRGATVIATARPQSITRRHTQETTTRGRLAYHPLDVSDPNQVKKTVAQIIECHGRIDFLINNAAMSMRSLVGDLTGDEIDQNIAVNFKGPLLLIQEVLPHMREKRSGRILNISSVGGMMAMPCMGIYSASKFALEGLSESLWYECRPWGVHVILIEPGFTLTGALQYVAFSSAARKKIDSNDGAIYTEFEAFVQKLYQRFGTPQKVVVRNVMRALNDPNPSLRYPATADARFFFWLRRLLPRRIYHRVLYMGLPKSLRTAEAAAAAQRALATPVPVISQEEA